ncbi:MAG TPA: amino acid ABC transporter substrate-binding protein [Methylomirabilota bacterium]|nr:amino acid ABC transporter substrate-binding protein [Methylomirabilota bacterium]
MRTKLIACVVALLFVVVFSPTANQPSAQQAAPTSIKIGYAISITGPYAPGAGHTSIQNYKLWIKDVNDTGGIYLSKYKKKVPLEVIEYDDRSEIDNMVRLVERLILNDKVDFLLPPWGTAMHLAAAPIFNKYGYPHLAITAAAMKIKEFAPRWPNSFWFLCAPDDCVRPLVDISKDLKAKGKLGGKVAIIHIADQLGIELASAAADFYPKAGFEVVYNKSYPLGVADLSPQLREIMRLNPDVFFAASYPGDTFMIIDQSQVLGFNPSIFYTAVGPGFAPFKGKFGAKAEGIMGFGGWVPSTPGAKEYLQRHVALNKMEVDRAGGVSTYASLQILQQAIEKVGDIDRKAVVATIARDTFQTVHGPIRFENQRWVQSWVMGQWQHGEYVGVGPAEKPGAQPILFPKPRW